MKHRISQHAVVPLEKCGSRFDQTAADLFPDYSRSRIQGWIKSGELLLDGKSVKTNFKLAGGEQLALDAEITDAASWESEDIPLNVIFEDEHIIVLDKPIDLVVHPAAGNQDGTLLNGLLHYYPELALVPRAGIVHRLDKDTSGIMVVARTIESQNHLVAQLQARSVSRVYRAVVHGVIKTRGTVNAAMGRHPTQRTKMAVLKNGGKEAITHYESLELFDGFTCVQLKLETGRTHQIRVHMAHIGHPLVGDSVYGRNLSKIVLKDKPELSFVQEFPRQALHARALTLIHPKSQQKMSWKSDLPDDFEDLLFYLRDLRDMGDEE